MWKAMSLAIGVTLILVGVELFFVEELEVRKLRQTAAQSQNADGGLFQNASFSNIVNAREDSAPTRLIRPQDWMPWSLLAVGSIIVIYTFTIPGRRQE